MNPYTDILRKSVDNNIPLFTHLDLTYNCNLRCIHCYIEKREEKELSFYEITNIFEQLAEAGTLYLILSGGEIFTRNDFFPLARYAREKGFVLLLSTNGTLIDRDIADQIRELHPLKVEISIYGASAVTHDSITRVPGAYNKSIEAIKLLIDRNVRTLIKCPVMNKNISELNELKELAEKLGAEFISNPTISPKENGDKSPLKYVLSDCQMVSYFKDNVVAYEIRETKEDIPICNSGRCISAISAYGDVYPCRLLNISGGNIREKKFDEIWNSGNIFSRVRSLSLNDFNKCTTCEYLPYCQPCMGLFLLEKNSLTLPSNEVCKKAWALKEYNERQEI